MVGIDDHVVCNTSQVLIPGEEHDWIGGGKRGEDQGMDVGVVVLVVPE